MSVYTPEEIIASVNEEVLSKKAHIITPAENALLWVYAGKIAGREVTSSELVDFARRTGATLVTLCQYQFVPTETPDRHETCMACMAVAQQRMAEGG